MRKSLLAAAAVAPLVLVAASARAATTISSSQSTPVATATANNGQPDDLIIGSGVTIQPTTAAAPAATINSNNSLTIEGTIQFTDVDNATGVLIQGGHTGAFSNVGSISVSESYTPSDTNGDGVVDGPFAKGTGRYGVRLTGPAPFVGSFTNGGTILVQGNDSLAVSLEAKLQGDLANNSTIAAIGDRTYGLRETGGITGKATIIGSISATGGGATAASFEGDIGGALTFYGGVTATGYRVTARNADPSVNATLLPEDLLQAGPTVAIRGNVGGGVYVAAQPAGTVSTDTTTDADKDGIVDSAEGTGTITAFGAAPAMVIGATGKDVHLGAFGTGAYGYGLIVAGTVSGSGVFDNIAAAGLQIGTGDGTVHIDNGFRNIGTVNAGAFQQNAVALHLANGATVSALRNDGAITAGVTSAIASQSTAVQIDAGAVVNSLANTGSITAALTGDLGSATAVVDSSGKLSTVVNSNTISASANPAASTDIVQGKAIALDLHNNTSGISLTQTAPTTTTTTTTNSDGTTSTTTTTITPVLKGDILLGSGNDTVQFHGGTVTGALDFAAGSGSLTIDGGTVYAGKLTSSGVLSSVSVAGATLQDESASTIQLNTLAIGDQGVLVVSADPANHKATLFNVSGTASIASTGRLGLFLNSLPTGPATYTVIKAPTLSVGVTDADLTAQAPYLFVADFHTNAAAGTIDLDLRRRTAQEAGLNRAETAALDPIYADLTNDPGIERAFLSQNDRAGLVGTLDQMLPDHAGGVFRALSWISEAQSAAAGDGPMGQAQAGPTRAWTSEIVMSEHKDVDQASAYNILAFGAQAGLESVSSRGDALGARIGFIAGNVRNPDLASDNLLGVSQLNAGVYWRGNLGPLRADAQLDGGFLWAKGRREFLFSDSIGVVHRTAEANWSGYSLSGRVGLRYFGTLGRVFFQPGVHLDYFRLHEGGYTETGGGDAFDLNVGSRTGDVLSLTGDMTAGFEWGAGFRWRPQIEFGYRTVLSGSAGTTDAEAVAGGTPFLLAAESIRSGALIGRVGLRVYNDYLDLLLDGGAEVTDEYTDIDVRLTARTVF